MPFLSFKNVGISGIAACVPRKILKNCEFTELLDANDLNKTIQTTGVVERRVVRAETCASDLCYEAALRLFNDLSIKKESIDMLIFVSQTPDYRIPATAITLQHRLGLQISTAAFDVNLGCSGYVYGLSMAFSYASSSGIQRILLLVGDTVSKFVSKKDKTTALLFGDGGSATLIEKKGSFGDSFFSLNSDGSGADALKIKGGGYRYPSSTETLKEKVFKGGSLRNDEQLLMDGAEIFNFTLDRIPGDIKNLVAQAELDLDKIDAIILHQANKFITDYLIKKLKYPLGKVPYSIGAYGNTSGVSIPLTIVSEWDKIVSKNKFLLCGFGVGLSWATTVVEMHDCRVSDLVEV